MSGAHSKFIHLFSTGGYKSGTVEKCHQLRLFAVFDDLALFHLYQARQDGCLNHDRKISLERSWDYFVPKLHHRVNFGLKTNSSFWRS